MSVNAPEFIPKFSAPLGDWNAHHPETQFQQAPQVFAQNSRSFPPQQQQQIPFSQAQHQRQPRYEVVPVYQGSRSSYGQTSRHDHVNLNHHHNYSNQQQQPPQMFMMNQQGAPNQLGNNFQMHGGGGGYQQPRGGIHNRLNYNNAQNVEPVALEPLPHKQVSWNLHDFDRQHSHRKFFQTETEQVALDYLSEVVSKLNDNPGLFENYQKRLREIFLELANNHFVMSNAIETIFEQV